MNRREGCRQTLGNSYAVADRSAHGRHLLPSVPQLVRQVPCGVFQALEAEQESPGPAGRACLLRFLGRFSEWLNSRTEVLLAPPDLLPLKCKQNHRRRAGPVKQLSMRVLGC